MERSQWHHPSSFNRNKEGTCCAILAASPFLYLMFVSIAAGMRAAWATARATAALLIAIYASACQKQNQEKPKTHYDRAQMLKQKV